MGLSRTDVLTINATAIAGLVVLLTLTNIGGNANLIEEDVIHTEIAKWRTPNIVSVRGHFLTNIQLCILRGSVVRIYVIINITAQNTINNSL